MNPIGENYCTALHLAVQRDGGWDDFELVRFLLKNGANPIFVIRNAMLRYLWQ